MIVTNIKENRIKIIDFGSVSLKNTSDRFFGSIQYQPPQLEKKEQYTRKFDIYSFGILAWEIQQFGLKFDDMFIEQFNNTYHFFI